MSSGSTVFGSTPRNQSTIHLTNTCCGSSPAGRARPRRAGRSSSSRRTSHRTLGTIRPVDQGGYGLDGLWNDDFHHSAAVAMTGRREAYFTDYRGTPQEFVSAAKYGYLFQGQRYAWQKQPRGTRADGIEPASFVNFLENHDQLANCGAGSRTHATHDTRTLPRDVGAVHPHARHADALSGAGVRCVGPVRVFRGPPPGAGGRRSEGSRRISSRSSRAWHRRRCSASCRCRTIRGRSSAPVLDWREDDTHGHHRRLYTDLLSMRRSDRAFTEQRAGAVDGAVLAPEAFALHYGSNRPEEERLLWVNLGPDLIAGSFAEPLLAPPDGCAWQLQWSSEDPDYGGTGTPEVVGDHGWRIPGHAAVVLRPMPVETQRNAKAGDSR